jgi:hypothetical protein
MALLAPVAALTGFDLQLHALEAGSLRQCLKAKTKGFLIDCRHLPDSNSNR